MARRAKRPLALGERAPEAPQLPFALEGLGPPEQLVGEAPRERRIPAHERLVERVGDVLRPGRLEAVRGAVGPPRGPLERAASDVEIARRLARVGQVDEAGARRVARLLDRGPGGRIDARLGREPLEILDGRRQLLAQIVLERDGHARERGRGPRGGHDRREHRERDDQRREHRGDGREPDRRERDLDRRIPPFFDERQQRLGLGAHELLDAALADRAPPLDRERRLEQPLGADLLVEAAGEPLGVEPGARAPQPPHHQPDGQDPERDREEPEVREPQADAQRQRRARQRPSGGERPLLDDPPEALAGSPVLQRSRHRQIVHPSLRAAAGAPTEHSRGGPVVPPPRVHRPPPFG